MAFDIFRLAGRVVLNSAGAIRGLRDVRNSSDITSESMRELMRRFYENERRMNGFEDETEELEDDLENLGDQFRQTGRQSTSFGEKLKKMGHVVSSVGNNIKSAGHSMSMFVTAPILAGIAGAIKQASDMNETISKTKQVFEEGASTVLKWSDHTLKSVGLAKGSALDMAATYGDMGTAMGLNTKQAQKMAMSLVDLTGDMASFKNMKPDEIHIALTGAYTGETEALKRLGIVMTVANLERFASSQGIKKEYKEMTQSEKIQLRYNYIMKASKNSIGDFARTQDSAANQMRIFTEGLKESGAKIGTILLPYFTKAITIVNKLMDRFNGLSPAMQKIILIAALLVAGIGPLLIVIGTLITFIGGVVAAIGTIGLPVAAVIAAIIPFIAILGGLIAVIGTAAYKSGVLQKAFNFLKNIINTIKLIIQGDFVGAWELLTQKMGFSHKKAGEFIQKISEMHTKIKGAIKVIKDVGKLIKAMFDEDKQKVVNLLIKKFKFSKDEANKFWKNVKELKKEIGKFAKKLKDDGVKALLKFADYVKRASQWIIDHRKQIAQAISKIITFARIFVSKAKQAYETAKWFVKWGLKIKGALDSARNKVISTMGKIKSTLDGMRNKAWNWGYNLIKGFANGIASAYNYLKEKVGAAARIISDFLGHHSPTKEGPGKTSDKWGPNLITMLSDTMLKKKGLLRDTMNKIAAEMDLNNKINNIGVSGSGSYGNSENGKSKIILQLINPKFFNQQDVNKMMEPVIQRLEFMGFGSR